MHRLFAEHMNAEHPVKTEGRGRVVDVWKMRRIGLDNHFFDGVVGCCVGASMQGAALPGTSESTPYVARRKRKRVKLSEIQQQKRMKRWTANAR